MVLHAGIVCYEKTKKGKLVTYNTETKERNSKDVLALGPNDYEGVENLFQSIKSLFEGNKPGCLCVCLGNKYGNDIRRKFLEVGKSFGFSKAEITDWLSADFCDLVSKTDVFGTFQELKGFIWIFCGARCRAWKKFGDKAEYVRDYIYDGTMEGLAKIKEQFSGDKDQLKLVIYGDKLRPSYQEVQRLFGADKVRVYSEMNQENGVLIKARILGGDNDIKKYAAHSFLEEKIEVKMNGTPIFTARLWQKLPINDNKELSKPDGTDELEIISYGITNRRCLPEENKFPAKFYVDVNGICKVDIGSAAVPKKQKDPKKAQKGAEKLPTKMPPPSPAGDGNSPSLSQMSQSSQPRVPKTNLAKQKPQNSQSNQSLNNSGNQRGGRTANRGGKRNNNPQPPQNSNVSIQPQGSQLLLSLGISQNSVPQMTGNVQMHPGMPPNFPQPAQFQQPNPYPNAFQSQQFQNPGYFPNSGYPMNPGYPPNPSYANVPQSFTQQFQNMGVHTPPPPPYFPTDSSSHNNQNERGKSKRGAKR